MEDEKKLKKIEGKQYLLGLGNREKLDTMTPQKVSSGFEFATNVEKKIGENDFKKALKEAHQAAAMGNEADLRSKVHPVAKQLMSEGNKDEVKRLMSVANKNLEEIRSNKLKTLASKAMSATKKLPGLGGLVAGALAAYDSGDVSAAVPGLNDVESLGPRKGDEGYDIENPSSDRNKEMLLKRVRSKMSSQK